MDIKIVKELKDIFLIFTNKISEILKTPLDNAFILSMYLLSNNKLAYINNINEKDNEIFEKLFNNFKNIEYRPSELRRAYIEAYLDTLKNKENYTIDVTLELPIVYLRLISNVLVSNIPYSNINILNALGNNGNLACSLSISDYIDSKNIYVTVKNEKEEKIATNLRNLTGFSYEITKSLPSLSYRCDLIISDPFLRTSEDILIFFEDYLEYLNQGGFFVVILPTQFVRSRIFSDLLEDHNLILLGLIEYPSDLMEGVMKSSIVIIEKKDKRNKEFFSAEMPSVKDVEGNMKIMNEIKEYLIEYFKGE